MIGGIIAAEALRLKDTPFRLHGRSEVHGLDCIGLVAQCLAKAGIRGDVPTGYSIRGGSVTQISSAFRTAGFKALAANNEPLADGDIMVAAPDLVQLHLLIRASVTPKENGFIHAHAGLGRVVFTPDPCPWPIKTIFRYQEV